MDMEWFKISAAGVRSFYEDEHMATTTVVLWRCVVDLDFKLALTLIHHLKEQTIVALVKPQERPTDSAASSILSLSLPS